MSVVRFERGTLIQGQQNGLGTFDADIDDSVCDGQTNADLTLYLRIHFIRVEPSAASQTYNDSDGTAVPIRRWTDATWRRFKQRFVSGVQRKWNGKFWLRTPPSYTELNWQWPNWTHRCNLYCRMEVSHQADARGSHLSVPVVRIDGNHFFRSEMALYSDRDLRAERLTRGSPFYTHLHEVGHLIGLEHPGHLQLGCVNGGEEVCYAGVDGQDDGVMGMGSRIYPRHALAKGRGNAH